MRGFVAATFYREKLVEVVRALVVDGDLDVRLTYAAGCRLPVDDEDVPADRLAEFERGRDPLLQQPMMAEGEIRRRDLGPPEGQAAVQAVVKLRAGEMG